MGSFPSGQNDLAEVLLYRFRHLEAVFNVSDAKYLIKWRGKDLSSGKWLWGETPDTYRDITAVAKALGGNGGIDGVIGAPIYDGRTLPGAASATVSITNGKAIVTVAAKGGNCIRQRIYMSKSGTTTPLYLAAEGDDGFAALGITLGGTAYPIADANLLEAIPGYDRSQTNGFASLGTPATPTLANDPSGGAGTLENGNRVVKLVNVAPWDTYEKRKIGHQFIVFDRTTGLPEKFPAGSFEEWIVGD